MNTFFERLGIICIIIAVAAMIGVCIGQTAISHYLICRVTTWQGTKDVHCQRVGSDVRGGGEDTPAPTVTGYYWTPESSDTAEPTQEATATPEATWTAEPPYPLPLDPVYWWKR